MKNLIIVLLALLLPLSGALAKGKLQDADFKSLAELQALGAGKAQLLSTAKIYDSGMDDQLNNLISEGKLGGIPAWVAGRSYVAGNVVAYTDNQIYKCTTANSDASFNYSNWQRLGGSGGAGLTWNAATADLTVVPGNSYTASATSIMTFTLPATCALGDSFQVAGLGTYGYYVGSNTSATQTLVYQGTSSGASWIGYPGPLWKNSNNYDAATFVCTKPNAIWSVINATGGSVQTAYTPGVPLPDPVIAYYQLDETGNAIDQASGLSLTQVGTVNSVAGLFANARGPWSNSNYLYSTNSNFVLANTDAWAVDFWFKLPSAPAANNLTSLVEIGGDESQSYQIGLKTSAGGSTTIGMDYYASYYNFRYNLYNVDAFIGDGKFHHVVGTFIRNSGSLSMTLYVDGTQRGTATDSRSQTVNAPGLRIGNWIGTYTTSGANPAYVDELALWYQTMPTTQQISDRYANGLGKKYMIGSTLPTTGLLAYYKMDSTGNLTDLVGSHNLTDNGSHTTTTGKWGNGITGWGLNNYYYSSNTDFLVSLDTAAYYAYDFWIKLPSAATIYGGSNSQGCIAFMGNASEAFDLGYIAPTSSTLFIGVDPYAGYYGYRNKIDVTSWAGDGNFHHVFVSYSKPANISTATVSYWFDGVPMGSADIGGYTSSRTTGWFSVGRIDPAGYNSQNTMMNPAVVMDDLAIWKGTAPLSPQIVKRYYAGTGRQYQ